MAEISARIVKTLQIAESPNPKFTGIVFDTTDGPFAFVIANEYCGVMIDEMIRVAAKRAQGQPKQTKDRAIMTARPVPVQSLGFAVGRTNQEAILSLHLGGLTMSYYVDASMLANMCKTLLSHVQQVSPPKSN